MSESISTHDISSEISRNGVKSRFVSWLIGVIRDDWGLFTDRQPDVEDHPEVETLLENFRELNERHARFLINGGSPTDPLVGERQVKAVETAARELRAARQKAIEHLE